MKILTVSILLLGVATSAMAQSEPIRQQRMNATGLAAAEEIARPFFTTIQRGDSPQAYTNLFAGTVVASRTAELTQLAAQTTAIGTNYGHLQTWEVRDSRCASERYCQVRYILYYENGPVGVWLNFYRNPTGRWLPITVLVGDNAAFFFDD